MAEDSQKVQFFCLELEMDKMRVECWHWNQLHRHVTLTICEPESACDKISEARWIKAVLILEFKAFIFFSLMRNIFHMQARILAHVEFFPQVFGAFVAGE